MGNLRQSMTDKEWWDLAKKIIERSYIVSREPYRSLQLDLKDVSVTKEFMEHLISLSEIVKPQELWSIQRQPTDKSVEWILNSLTEDNVLSPGIKIVHNPMRKIMEYENWDKGYIEGFLRMSGGVNKPDYFIWTYTKMEHLEEIVDRWAEYFHFLTLVRA